KKTGYDCSIGKLSGSILRLIKEGFLEVRGTGPHRIVNFVPKVEAWKRLMSANLKKTHQIVPGNYALEKMNLPFSGESALSKFSQLAEPRLPVFAVTNQQFLKIRATGKPIGDFGEPRLLYDVRKEDPELFSIKDAVNPIEIYMDLKNDPDERIQIALEEMLEMYGLSEVANAKG
ncbi:MAG: hypothetical protein IT289_05840, partial [Oligoflexia bacterium]|nr:hypothetical protein [Oligoflexia bacterium]